MSPSPPRVHAPDTTGSPSMDRRFDADPSRMDEDAPVSTPDTARPRRRSRGAMLGPAVVGGAIGLVCVAFVVSRMAAQWDEVRDEVADAEVGWLVLALVMAVAGMTWIAACWRRAIGLLGHETGRRRTVAWYFAGEIGKYVPGGVWPVLGRGELARRGGVPRSRAYPSVGLSLVALYLGGARGGVGARPARPGQAVRSRRPPSPCWPSSRSAWRRCTLRC